MLNKAIGDRYLVRELLGEGAHGTVYRAYDHVRKGDIALKLFKEGYMDVQTAEAARHFEVAEGSAVLPLLEVHPEFMEGQVTVMRLMEGTLADLHPVFASKAVHYTRRILTGLEYCHGHDDGVLHGDVKRSNVFLGPSGEVLLGDFGVADQLPGGGRGYTLEYAAPELLAGGERSEATDIWAAGVTFYELVTGELPFGQEPDLSADEIVTRIQAGDYRHPDAVLPYLPLRFRGFFREAFRVNPSDRGFTTAATMRNALRDLAVHVEWVRVQKDGYVVCFEGHEVTDDGHQTGVIYEASVVERPRLKHFEPNITRAPPGGSPRRLHGLPEFSGTQAEAGMKLRVWMRTLMERGDIPRS